MKLTTEQSQIVDKVFEVVEERTGICKEEILSKTRKGEVVFARHFMCWYLNGKGFHLKLIAKAVGLQDHSSVIHARGCIKNYIETEHNNKFLIDLMLRDLSPMCASKVKGLSLYSAVGVLAG